MPGGNGKTTGAGPNQLYRQYPNLHVYAYGSLPCLDPIIADACSEFITSIVYNNEFSARLSVASILRLRAAALMALSQDTADSTIASKLAHKFLFVSRYERTRVEEKIHDSHLNSSAMTTGDRNLHGYSSPCRNGITGQDQESSLWQAINMKDDSGGEINRSDSIDDFTNPFCASPDNVNLSGDPVSEFMETVPLSQNGSPGVLPEMFLPGFVIHIVPQKNSFHTPLWRSWRTQEKYWIYKAYTANREDFKDIVVSTSMFLDHLPWRCDYAMQKVLEVRSASRSASQSALYDGSQMV
ncbi:hypothetical protein HYC85_019683 [Camellia sinensis]|uniref:Uncharacterized protein n=1 Tax=Camellia sinensis TaxID=4442 RepID=A0A7J7GQ65_CAMSI|nr:hypothetical protein HYC85_019683 [Camellia sinensis]